MLLPSIFGESLLDDWMDFPDMRDFGNIEKKLYGKNAAHIMKTDVHEHDEGFELDIDLPGFKKEEIQLELEDGYLTVSAAKGLESDEKNKKGKLKMEKNVPTGKEIIYCHYKELKEEDIKAKFEDGVLKLSVPKKEAEKVPEKKRIMIEG